MLRVNEFIIDENKLISSIDFSYNIEKSYIKDNHLYLIVNDEVSFTNQNGLGKFTIQIDLYDLCNSYPNWPHFEIIDIQNKDCWNINNEENFDITLKDATEQFKDNYFDFSISKNSFIDLSDLINLINELNLLDYSDKDSKNYEDEITLYLKYEDEDDAIMIFIGYQHYEHKFYFGCWSDKVELYDSEGKGSKSLSASIDELIYDLNTYKRIIKVDNILSYIDNVISILSKYK